MTITRNRKCTHCLEPYVTAQIKSKFCSDVCKAAAKAVKVKQKRQSIAEKRVLKLPVAEEWLWLAREVKRAGTVECLSGHTAETLEQLFALRNYKYKTYDFDPDKRRSKFHLCHMQAVKGDKTVGLLHPHNLFIGPSLANQQHGKKSYHKVGLSIHRSGLVSKWLISDDMPESSILKKVTKYLGSVLIDYAKVNPIRMSQRLSLAKWINKNITDCPYPLAKLERMGMTELRKIRAAFEEKEVYQIDLSTKRSLVVALDEAVRLSEQLPAGQHRDNIASLIPVLRCVAAWLSRQDGEEGLASILESPYGVHWEPLILREGMDASNLRDFASFQAFQAMQGAPLDKKMILNTLRKYLAVTSMTPDYSKSNSSMQEHFKDKYINFYTQVPVIQNAILTLGLCSAEQEYEYLKKVKEADFEIATFAGFGYDTCEHEFDYSGLNIQIEDDYTPNPSNPRLRRFIEPIFIDF